MIPLLILCGGRSRRMGFPKPLLRYRGQTLLERLCAHARPHRSVWLAAAGERFAHTDGALYFADALPQRQGALSAILPALQHAHGLGLSGLLVMQCDTLLDSERLWRVLQIDESANTIVALRSEGQIHPLLAFWSVAVLDDLQDFVWSGQRRVMAWLDRVAVQTVAMPTDWEHFCNFNTPHEFEQACRSFDNSGLEQPEMESLKEKNVESFR